MPEQTKKLLDGAALPAPLQEEEALLAKVQRAIRANPVASNREDYRATLMELRESLSEERLPEDMASIMEQMERVSGVLRRVEHQAAQIADPQTPYFGHLRVIDENELTRDILIGKQTFIRGEVAIVDWRDAPIARVFYQHREGEDYTMTIDREEVDGEVLLRRTLTITGGELVRVGTEERTWIKEDGSWVDATSGVPALRGGAGVAHRPEPTKPGDTSGLKSMARKARFDKHLPEVASLLDREQYDLITRRDSGIIAVQGSAGSGKTTVALHRVAWLVFQDPRRYAPEESIVVVYSRALARYIAQVLPSLGVNGVDVVDFEGWSERLIQRHLPEVTTRLSDTTPSTVCRFKQHAGLIPALAAAAAASPDSSPVRCFEELFTSRSWIGEVATTRMAGLFSEAELDEIHRWCSRLHAHRTADEPSADDEPSALDIEDLAILLRLQQLLVGPLEARRGKQLRYAHLVIDEVQDMSPLELVVLLDTVQPGMPVTLAGDLAQQLEDASDFQSWDYVFQHLGDAATQIRPLQISYRSTEPIMRLAQAVLGPLAPAEPPTCARGGSPVELFQLTGKGEAFTFLSDMLQDLLRREPNASVAILTRFEHQSIQAFDALHRAGVTRLRRIQDQDFEFTPGIEIAEIHQTKGLEFDYVVLLDVDAATYPLNDASRRLLHVGMTRAAHLCWLLTTQAPSPLLPEWLKPSRPL